VGYQGAVSLSGEMEIRASCILKKGGCLTKGPRLPASRLKKAGEYPITERNVEAWAQCGEEKRIKKVGAQERPNGSMDLSLMVNVISTVVKKTRSREKRKTGKKLDKVSV